MVSITNAHEIYSIFLRREIKKKSFKRFVDLNNIYIY